MKVNDLWSHEYYRKIMHETDIPKAVRRERMKMVQYAEDIIAQEDRQNEEIIKTEFKDNQIMNMFE